MASFQMVRIVCCASLNLAMTSDFDGASGGWSYAMWSSSRSSRLVPRCRQFEALTRMTHFVAVLGLLCQRLGVLSNTLSSLQHIFGTVSVS